jgi:hypothetical protein
VRADGRGLPVTWNATLFTSTETTTSKTCGDRTRQWKVRMIEEEFKRLMFDVTDV